MSRSGAGITAAPSLVRGLGLISSVALIVGNMVGTGIYTLPASLARAAGPVSLVSWVLTAAGYLFLAVIYADMGSAYPRSGGPSVYAREAFGDFVGFEIAYSYWLSVIIGNAAIVIATVGYMDLFSGVLAGSPAGQVAVSLVILWGITVINIFGVREGGTVQVIATLAKLVPLVVFSVAAIGYFNPRHLVPFAPKGTGTIPIAAALIVWAFSGVESATVPAEEVEAPRKTIRRSTFIGFGIATLVYLVVSISVMGVLPNDEIAASTGPLALAASKVLGPWGVTLMAAGALISGLGVLNGWVLLSGRIPLSTAHDRLFPKPLARIHARFHTPHVSLIIASAAASLLLLLRLSRSLLETFEFIALLSVLMTLIPHVTTTLGECLLAKRDPDAFPCRPPGVTAAISMIGLLFVVWIIYGTGGETVGLGSLMLAIGAPMYLWMRKTNR